jgi:F-type H+-transporting ATPase subunit epsilon
MANTKTNLSTNNTIDVKVVGAHGELYNGAAQMVVATAYNGEIGIKPKHAPFIAMLKPGQVVIHNSDASDEQVFYVSGGIIEVQPNLVTILADDAQRAADIDESKAEKAKANALKILADKSDALDYAKLQAQLAQSLAQLRALKRLKSQADRRRN